MSSNKKLNKENIDDSRLSNGSKGSKKRNYSKRSPFGNNNRRETVDPADLSALIQDLDNSSSNTSFNSLVNKSSFQPDISNSITNEENEISKDEINEKRRETVDANDLQEMMMFLEDSSVSADLSVSIGSTSNGKNKSGIMSTWTDATPSNISQLSIINKSNTRLSSSTIATNDSMIYTHENANQDSLELSISSKSSRRQSLSSKNRKSSNADESLNSTRRSSRHSRSSNDGSKMDDSQMSDGTIASGLIDVTAIIDSNIVDDSNEEVNDKRRETVDANDLQEMMMFLEDSSVNDDLSVSVSSKSKSNGKNKSRISIASSVATPDVSQFSIVNKSNRRLSSSTIATNDSKISMSSNNSRQTVDSADMREMLLSLDNSTLTADLSVASASNEPKRSKRKSGSNSKSVILEESNAATRRSPRLSVSSMANLSVSGVDSTTKGRRETVDATDINKLMNELDESSVYKEVDSASSFAIPANVSEVDNASNLSVSQLDTTNQSKGKKSRSSVQGRRSSVETMSLSFCNSELSKNSSISDLNSPPVRRETVDPTDMANLMNELMNDSSVSENNYHAKGRGQKESRESIDTVVLLDSVAGLLDNLTDDDNNESSSRDMRDRRHTADQSEIHKLVSELAGSNSSKREVRDRDDSTVCMDDNLLENSYDSKENSIITVATTDLLQSIQDTLAADEDPDDITSGSLVSLAGLLEHASQSQRQETMIAPSPALPKIPNSILKSAKKNKDIASSVNFNENLNSLKKSVVFGSPEAAEFNKYSPTTSFTPMNKQEVQSYFPQNDENVSKEEEEVVVDEITNENSRILEEWDRLTNGSECSSPDEVIVEDSGSIAMEVSSNRSSISRGSRRRKSKVQPFISDYDSNIDLSNQSVMDTSSFGNCSKTVSLPDTLADLIIENTKVGTVVNSSFQSTSDQTEEIEMNLGALIKRLDGKTVEKSPSQSESNDSHGSSQILSLVTNRCGVSILSSNSDADTLGPLIGIDNNNFEFSNNFSEDFNGSVEISTNNDELSGEMDISIDENDYTHKLEDNLCDLVSSIAQSKNIISVSKVVKQVDEEISVILNSCDDENRNATEDIDCDISTATTVLEVDLSRKSISIEQSSTKPSSATIYSPFTHQPVISANPSTTLSTNTLISKIRSLNAGARTNSLSQCSTPVVPSGRMSIGMKRLCMMTSAKKPNVTEKQVVIETNQEMSQTDKENLPLSQNNIITQVEKEVGKVFSVTKLSNVNVNNASMDNSEYELTLRNIVNGYFFFVQQTRLSAINYSIVLETIVGTAIKGSILKVLPESFLESIDQFQNGLLTFDNLWNIDSFDVSKVLPSIEDYIQCYTAPSSILENISITSNTNIGKLLLDVSSLAILEKTESMRIQNNIDSTATDSSEVEKQLDGQEKFFRKALNTPVPQRRRSLDKKQSNYSELSHAYNALQQLNLQVEVINKLSHCRVKTFRSDLISIDSYLSPLVIVTINFHIKKSISDDTTQLIISNTEVDLDLHLDPSSEQIESKIASAFFASILCSDELHGPLSPSSLTKIESPAQIPQMLRQLSGAICKLRLSLLKVSVQQSEGFKMNTIHKDNSWNIQLISNNNNEVNEIPIRTFISNNVY